VAPAHPRRSAKAEEAAQRASAAENDLNAAQDTATAAARCAPGHREAIQGWRADLPQARRAAHEAADRQAGAIGQLERLLAEVAARRAALEAARIEVDRLTAEVQAAIERLAVAEQNSAERAVELARGYRFYLRGLTELRIAAPDELVDCRAREHRAGPETFYRTSPAGSRPHRHRNTVRGARTRGLLTTITGLPAKPSSRPGAEPRLLRYRSRRHVEHSDA
jgi:hypothetical protein